jgi:hypothetical protein
MSKMRRILPVLALASAFAAIACSYDPRPADGTQQCYVAAAGKQPCPNGYVCASGYCYSVGNEPKTPSGSGGIVTGVGGVVGTGGIAQGSGGIISGSGGATIVVPGSGGRTGNGGIVGSGGKGSGGVAGSGGVGGITSTGGTSTPPNAGNVVSFSNYQAQGAMTGFGWIALGALDTVTSPTCNSPAGNITNATPCDYTNWSSPSAYCMTGYIPAVPSGASSTDYSNNWGIEIGINATPIAGGILGQSFTSMSLTVGAAAALSGLRVSVHRKGDGDTVSYCATLTSGAAIPFTSLNTACWDSTGSYFPSADVPNIDKIMVSVPSSSTPITVNNLCVTGITFTR